MNESRQNSTRRNNNIIANSSRNAGSGRSSREMPVARLQRVSLSGRLNADDGTENSDDRWRESPVRLSNPDMIFPLDMMPSNLNFPDPPPPPPLQPQPRVQQQEEQQRDQEEHPESDSDQDFVPDFSNTTDPTTLYDPPPPDVSISELAAQLMVNNQHEEPRQLPVPREPYSDLNRATLSAVTAVVVADGDEDPLPNVPDLEPPNVSLELRSRRGPQLGADPSLNFLTPAAAEAEAARIAANNRLQSAVAAALSSSVSASALASSTTTAATSTSTSTTTTSGGGGGATASTAVVTDMSPEVRAALGDLEVPEGVDPSFLAALPSEMREEVIQEHLRMQRIRQRAQQNAIQIAHDSLVEVNPEFLAALPPNIQSEVLMQQRIEQQRQAAQSANPDDPVDTAAFFQNLPDNLRQAVSRYE